MSDDMDPLGGGGQTFNGFQFTNPAMPGKKVTVVVVKPDATTHARWLTLDPTGNSPRIGAGTMPPVSSGLPINANSVSVYLGKIDGAGQNSGTVVTPPLKQNGLDAPPPLSSMDSTNWVAGDFGVHCQSVQGPPSYSWSAMAQDGW